MMKKVYIFLILLIGFILSSFAHKPIFDDAFHGDFNHALVIKDAQVSQITYHEFSNEEPVFWVKFLGIKDEEIQIVLNVPYSERLADMDVYMALFRKGSDDLNTASKKSVDLIVPFDTPEDHEGVVFYSGFYDREFFHEPFSNTNSWFVLRQRFTPVETGVYYAAIWPEEDFSAGGKVGFSIGTLERFSPLDIIMLGEWIEGIRRFHEE